MRQIVIITTGIPASGKSTWAKKFVLENEGFKRINRDELRLMIDNGKWSPQHEKFIVEIRNNLLCSALKKGFNVIIDDTNLGKNVWKDICKVVESLNIDVVVSEKRFPIDLSEAIDRDLLRQNSIGKPVIESMWKKYVQIKNVAIRVAHFDKKLPKIFEVNSLLPKAIICDLDGTLAKIGPRSPYDASQCDKTDTPNMPVVETVRLFSENGYKILFVSGREDKDRDASMRFISKIFPDIFELDLAELHMRQTKDQRRDSIIKKEIWDNHIDGKYNVLFAVDDRNQVVSMWRNEIGLTVFQCAEGNF